MTAQLATQPIAGASVPIARRFGIPLLATMTLSSTRSEEGGVTSFAFVPNRPIPFRAGQHGLLVVPQGGFKPFSIASSPQDEMVALGTRMASGSKFKLALAALQPGASVRFFGPLGSFTIAGTADDLVLLAQGVGITPFRSILRDVRQRVVRKWATLVHVGGDHPFRTDTESLADRAIYPSNSESFRLEVAAQVESHNTATFMISGAPAFVEATKALLRDLGVAARQIRVDSMLGY
jgi:ferredoxin-NADP reductase